MALSDQVLQILACPACHGALRESDGYLHCPACSLNFPVREGIPVLLLSEAEKAKR
jgi:uncharacterized protein